MVQFDSKISEQDLYEFNLHHVYTSSQGIISLVAGGIGIGAAIVSFGTVDMFYTVAYVILGILFLIYLPVTLKIKSKSQLAMSPVLQGTLHFSMEDDGIVVTTDVVAEGQDNKAVLPWKNVYKIVTTKKSLLIYSSRVNAYIIPKNQVIDIIDEIKNECTKNLEAHRVSIKW